MLRWFWNTTTASPAPVVPHADDSEAAATLQRRLVRVTKADLRCVTPDDIKRVRARLADAELSAALLLMLETNRFADVLATALTSTWAEAAAGVSEKEMGLSEGLMRDRLGLLYNVLPYLSDEFLDAMGGARWAET